MIKRTMQPCDADLVKLKFPCYASIKYDGVKVCRLNDNLVGRSFKSFRNKHLQALFNKPEFEGFEGEIVVGNDFLAQDMCRTTTSGVNSIEGEPDFRWLVFDYVTATTVNLPYDKRLDMLITKVAEIANPRITVVPVHIMRNLGELLLFESQALNNNAEGVITRDIQATYKQGRVTPKSQEVLRLKRFVDCEGVVVGLNEGVTNNNDPTVNELGLTSRSTHQDNMQPNGMIGSLIVETADGIDTVSAGAMTHDDRIRYFNNPDKILGKVIKFKYFPKGIKDKKRFPTFVCFRDAVDIGDY